MLNKIIYIAVFLSFASCFTTSKTNTDRNYADFARNNIQLVEEMAGYAVLFCRENNISSFDAETVADKDARKKMLKLGRVITVSYGNPARSLIDSTVTFKTVSIPNGVLEYIYDFAVHPRLEPSETATRENALVRVSDRVYYRRRPFPFM